MRTISADQLSNWKGRIIDVRNLNEFAAERLPGAECVPLGTLDSAISQWRRDEPLLVMCRSGMRSRQAYDQMLAAGFTDVTMLSGGIEACKKAGVNVIIVRKTIPIIRQVMVAASALLVLGLLLASVDPRFLLITWFIALGLGFAGVTGFCPMARLLEAMPWNKTPECKNACGCEGAVQKG